MKLESRKKLMIFMFVSLTWSKKVKMEILSWNWAVVPIEIQIKFFQVPLELSNYSIFPSTSGNYTFQLHVNPYVASRICILD